MIDWFRRFHALDRAVAFALGLLLAGAPLLADIQFARFSGINASSIVAGSITAGSITDSGLTAGRVTYAGTGGLLSDEAAFTYTAATNTLVAETLSGTNAVWTAIGTPSAPTVTPSCTGTCVTTYGYKIVALLSDGTAHSAASTEGTTAVNAATLDATHFNTISWSAVTGATSYDVYRTTGGAAPPKKIFSATTTISGVVDDGIAGSALTPPATNTTGTLTAANVVDSALTATRVTFAGASGLLSDDADMTFATDTLTVTKAIVPTLFTAGAATSGAANAVNIGETANCITFEGATSDAIQTRLCATDPTTNDSSYFLPNLGTAGAQNGNILVRNTSTAAVWDASGSAPNMTFGGVITFGATPKNTAVSLTTSTMARESDALITSTLSSFTWTNAQVAALPASAGDINVATIPAKTQILDAMVVITGQAAGPTTVTVSCGDANGGTPFTNLVLPGDAKAAVNTVYGDALAERGTSIDTEFWYLPSYTATTLVTCHFISTGGALSTVTGSTGRVILVTRALP